MVVRCCMAVSLYDIVCMASVTVCLYGSVTVRLYGCRRPPPSHPHAPHAPHARYARYPAQILGAILDTILATIHGTIYHTGVLIVTIDSRIIGDY